MLSWFKDILEKSASPKKNESSSDDDTSSGLFNLNIESPFKFNTDVKFNVSADVNTLIDQITALLSPRQKLSASTINYGGIADVITTSNKALVNDGVGAFKSYLTEAIKNCANYKTRLKLQLYLIDSLSLHAPDEALSQFEYIRDEFHDNAEAGLVIANALHKSGMTENAYNEYTRVSRLKNIGEIYKVKTRLSLQLLDAERFFIQGDIEKSRKILLSTLTLAEKNNLFNDLNFALVQLFLLEASTGNWEECDKLLRSKMRIEVVSDPDVMAGILNCFILVEMYITRVFPYEYIKKAVSNFESLASHNAIMLFNSFSRYTIGESANKKDLEYSIELLSNVCRSYEGVDLPIISEAQYCLAELKTVSYDFKGAYQAIGKVCLNDKRTTSTHEYIQLKLYLKMALSIPLKDDDDLSESISGRLVLTRGYQHFLLSTFYSVLEKGKPPVQSFCQILRANIAEFQSMTFELYEQAEKYEFYKAQCFHAHMCLIGNLLISLLNIFSGDIESAYDELISQFENDTFFWEPIKNLQLALALTCISKHSSLSNQKERVTLKLNEYLEKIEGIDEWELLNEKIRALSKKIKKIRNKPFSVLNIIDSLIEFPLDTLQPYYGKPPILSTEDLKSVHR